MSQAFPNEYNLRTVAESSSKPCMICHRSSTKVLITPLEKDKVQDFFYICASHLTDKGFASPIVDEKAEAEKRKQDQLAKEKAAIIAEYEAKMKKKGKGKEEKKDDPVQSAEDEKDVKLKALEEKAAVSSSTDDGPRQFNLNRTFYQTRLDKRAASEKAKRDAARFRDPKLFPAAPSGDIS